MPLLAILEVCVKAEAIFGLRDKLLTILYGEFREAAYRQFAFCRRGKLGKGNGRVMPSSVVLQIFFEYLITLAPTPRLCVTRKKNRSRDWLFNCCVTYISMCHRSRIQVAKHNLKPHTQIVS